MRFQAGLVTALSHLLTAYSTNPHSTPKQLRFLRMHRQCVGSTVVFTIMPALPVGLNFNAAIESQVRLTGFTSAYAVTATNSAGLAQTTLNLSVKDETILGFHMRHRLLLTQ